jgi:hypothetical protein
VLTGAFLHLRLTKPGPHPQRLLQQVNDERPF